MYGDKGGFRPKPAPVNQGDELEVTIEAQGKKGDGIAKKEGFVLFVPSGKKGQTYKVRITKVLKNVGFAEIVSAVGGKAASSDDDSESSEESDEESDDEESEDEDDEESEDEEEDDAEDTENFGEE